MNRHCIRVPHSVCEIMERALNGEDVKINNFGLHRALKNIPELVKSTPVGHNSFDVKNRGVGVDYIGNTAHHKLYKINPAKRLI